MLDLDVLLAGDANVCVKLGYGSYFSTNLKLYDIYFKGRLRIELSDIGPAICPFSSLKFVLPQRPAVNAATRVTSNPHALARALEGGAPPGQKHPASVLSRCGSLPAALSFC